MAKHRTRLELSRSDSDASPGRTSPDITRREWLLRLGGTAVLAGFQGLPAAGQRAHTSGETGHLPPGLYAPSQDHMTHALASDGRYFPLPPNSETDVLRPPSGPFQPQFFSAAEFRAVKRLVATLLGETETSREMGATILEIAQWIDREVFDSAAVREAARNLSAQHRALAVAFDGEQAVRELESREPRMIWREGLEWISSESIRRWGKPFIDATPESQFEILNALNAPKGAENAGTRFFTLLKNQVAHGFYTSQQGLKELDYKGNSFYAECPGCVLTRKE